MLVSCGYVSGFILFILKLNPGLIIDKKLLDWYLDTPSYQGAFLYQLPGYCVRFCTYMDQKEAFLGLVSALEACNRLGWVDPPSPPWFILDQIELSKDMITFDYEY